ncbi:MAG: HEAT repeat domain-containing protein, partial [Myxococcota bacterium]
RAWEVFLAGVEHIQMEPVWGGREDTAGPLRASSARCLVQARYPRTLDLLAVLLADALPEPRLTAASLIPSAGVPGGASVLRLKLLHGDTHPEVTTACTTALLELDPDDGLDFVVHRLLNGGDQEQAEAVAMGLGESRLPKAVTPLIEAWPLRVEPGWRRHIFACLVLLRQQTAYDHLLELLNGDSDPVASDVAHTLAPVIAHDPRLAAQLRAQLAHVPSRARRLLLLELLGDME